MAQSGKECLGAPNKGVSGNSRLDIRATLPIPLESYLGRALMPVWRTQTMRPMAALLVVALGSALMFGQQAGKAPGGQGKEMTGYLCDSKCVKQDAGKPACDPSCTEEGNQVVFVSDTGRVVPVDNPE